MLTMHLQQGRSKSFSTMGNSSSNIRNFHFIKTFGDTGVKWTKHRNLGNFHCVSFQKVKEKVMIISWF